MRRTSASAGLWESVQPAAAPLQVYVIAEPSSAAGKRDAKTQREVRDIMRDHVDACTVDARTRNKTKGPDAAKAISVNGEHHPLRRDAAQDFSHLMPQGLEGTSAGCRKKTLTEEHRNTLATSPREKRPRQHWHCYGCALRRCGPD